VIRASIKPVVCHFVRTYLRPTETFIANQFAAHQRYEPAMLCRERFGASPDPESRGATSYLQDHTLGHIAALGYCALRVVSRQERIAQAESIRAAGAVIVHGHFGTDSAFILPAVQRLGLPLVVSHYGYDVSRFPQAYLGMGGRYLAGVWKAADLHLAMTPMMRDRLISLGVRPESISVHHHGIDIEAWTPAWEGRSSGRDVLMVASLVEKKGHAAAIDAFSLVARAYPDVRLRLVGSGPLQRDLEKQVGRLGLTDRVDFLGLLPHGPELSAEYANARVFVHPSRTARNGDAEGLPSTILEAMACGLPVLATTHSGIPWAVTEAVNGYLVAEGDHVALAARMRGLLSDSRMAVGMGAAGRARVLSDFSLIKQVARLEALYDGVVDARADGRLRASS
jgi:colanic acid/amylovoran biosynthesis glycosyltransferase